MGRCADAKNKKAVIAASNFVQTNTAKKIDSTQVFETGGYIALIWRINLLSYCLC
jgi:hypothetical protein